MKRRGVLSGLLALIVSPKPVPAPSAAAAAQPESTEPYIASRSMTVDRNFQGRIHTTWTFPGGLPARAHAQACVERIPPPVAWYVREKTVTAFANEDLVVVRTVDREVDEMGMDAPVD